MTPDAARRSGAPAWGALVGALSLAACGSDPASDRVSSSALDGGPEDEPVACDEDGAVSAPPLAERTDDGAFTVTLVAVDPPRFSLGDNALTLRIDAADGPPLPGLSPAVVPWMPAHRHGSPRTVVVTDLGDGLYAAAPVNASMPGTWEIRVELPGDASSPPRAVLRLCVAER